MQMTSAYSTVNLVTLLSAGEIHDNRRLSVVAASNCTGPGFWKVFADDNRLELDPVNSLS